MERRKKAVIIQQFLDYFSFSFLPPRFKMEESCTLGTNLH